MGIPQGKERSAVNTSHTVEPTTMSCKAALHSLNSLSCARLIRNPGCYHLWWPASKVPCGANDIVMWFVISVIFMVSCDKYYRDHYCYLWRDHLDTWLFVNWNWVQYCDNPYIYPVFPPNIENHRISPHFPQMFWGFLSFSLQVRHWWGVPKVFNLEKKPRQSTDLEEYDFKVPKNFI